MPAPLGKCLLSVLFTPVSLCTYGIVLHMEDAQYLLNE